MLEWNSLFSSWSWYCVHCSFLNDLNAGTLSRTVLLAMHCARSVPGGKLSLWRRLWATVDYVTSSCPVMRIARKKCLMEKVLNQALRERFWWNRRLQKHRRKRQIIDRPFDFPLLKQSFVICYFSNLFILHQMSEGKTEKWIYIMRI